MTSIVITVIVNLPSWINQPLLADQGANKKAPEMR
jgi:hypothetical protein